jgi:hypothetical protein
MWSEIRVGPLWLILKFESYRVFLNSIRSLLSNLLSYLQCNKSWFHSKFKYSIYISICRYKNLSNDVLIPMSEWIRVSGSIVNLINLFWTFSSFFFSVSIASVAVKRGRNTNKRFYPGTVSAIKYVPFIAQSQQFWYGAGDSYFLQIL